MIRSLAEDISLTPTPRVEIIEGVLREGGKMLIAGPFLDKRAILLMLMELTVSIAEGERWLGFPCHKSRVLYINLELDRASCINSLNHIYDARRIPLKNPDNIHLWHLRGNTAPIEKLAPEIVRIVKANDITSVIIDPLYKVAIDSERDEDVRRFVNAADWIYSQVGCSIIYHDHTLVTSSTDRAFSGFLDSSTLASDADAVIYASRFALGDSKLKGRPEAGATAWRIQGALREYKPFAPINCWFSYPRFILCE